jgi:gamma-glutamylcyclotransferase (GGCT)/AIG2-like uncharacterized protein YtfP
MSELIFVYGTLKRGLSNHRYLSGQQFIGEARTAADYRLVDCDSYPGMVEALNGGVSVRGEVWEVDDACRQRLDVLEDVAHGMYTLERVALLAPFDSKEVFTYIYRWPTADCAEVGEAWTESTS